MKIDNKINYPDEPMFNLVNLHSSLLDEIGDGLTITDLNGKLIYVNKTVCKWLGKTLQELIGQPIFVFGENSAKGATQQDIIDKTLKNGTWTGEVINYSKDGREIILECRTKIIKDANGKSLAMCGVAKDITERKKNLNDLEIRRRYLETFDHLSKLLLPSVSVIPYGQFVATIGPVSRATRVHVLISSTDNKGNLCLSRQAQWCKDGNITPVQNRVSNFFMENIWPNIQQEFIDDKHVAIIAANEPENIRKFWNSYNIKSVLIIPIIVDEKLYGLISFDNCDDDISWTDTEIEFLRAAAVDLSHAIKRTKIKEELKSERDFAKNLIETAQTIVLVLDSNGNILQFNPYFEKLSGYSLEQVRGQNWFENFLPSHNKKDILNVFSRTKSGSKTLANVNPILTKNGELRHIEWFSKNLKDQYGNTIGILSTGHDITKRIETETELRQARQDLEKMVEVRTFELKQTNQQLLEAIEQREHVEKLLKETEKLAAAGKLAAQIAHEINNPLAGIKNSFLLVKDGISPEHKYFGYVARIEKEITRVSQIVRQMFDLYRPGSDPADRFNLYETINDIVKLLQIAQKEKSIHIKLSCNSDINIMLPEGLFRQIIYNILQNAIEASPINSEVEINAKILNSHLFVSISDNGRGIDETIKNKIFEPFFTTASGGPRSGLGLGLAITKDIITAMEGNIEFKNNDSKGTKFNIKVPIGNDYQ